MSYIGQNLPPSTSYIPPTNIELDANAATRNMQINLGIMRDTLEVPISDMNRHDVWKYQSNSSRPTLPPAHTLRMTNQAPLEDSQSSVQERYEQLVNGLPEHVRTALIANKAMAREAQITSLVALEYSLNAIAKALVIIESGGEPILRSSNAELRRQINEQVSKYVRDNFQKSGYELLKAFDEKMDTLGRNNPHYDDLSNYASLSKQALNALQAGSDDESGTGET